MSGNATALIIIDVQNNILLATDPRGAETLTALDAMVHRLAAVADRARAQGVPVIHVQHDGEPGHRLEKGSDGWRIRAELGPAVGEPVFNKSACDAFLGTGLEALLRERGIGHLIIGGCMTPYCIDTSVRSAVAHGFDVTLLADGHMTCDIGALRFEQIIAHHNRILDGFDVGPKMARVRASADFLA
jgi:nicotinamidase-related amidase